MNFKNKTQIVLFFLGIILILFISLGIYVSNINWWWNTANNYLENSIKDKITCEKKAWLSYTEINLKNCHNQKNTFKGNNIIYNIFNRELYISGLSVFIPKQTNSKKSNIPKLPKYINKIIIQNLNIPKLPINIKILEITRDIISLQEKYNIKIIANNLNIDGILQNNKHINLNIYFNKYLLNFKNVKSSLNGRVNVISENINNSDLIDVNFIDLSVLQNNVNIPIKLNGGIIFNKHTSFIHNFKIPFEINIGKLKLYNNIKHNKFYLQKTHINNIKQIIKLPSLEKGFVEGNIELNLKNLDETIAQINFEGINLKNNQNNIKNINGEIKLLPVYLLKNSINLKFNKNTNIKHYLSKLKLQLLKLNILNNNFNNIFDYTAKFHYNNSSNDIIGKVYLNNINYSIPEKKIGIHGGSGIIETINEKGNINIKGYQDKDIIFMQGIFSLLPVLKTDITLNIPELNYVNNNNNLDYNIKLNNIKLLASMSNNKLSLKNFSSVLNKIYISKNNNTIELNGGKIGISKHNFVQADNIKLNIKTNNNYSLESILNLNGNINNDLKLQELILNLKEINIFENNNKIMYIPQTEGVLKDYNNLLIKNTNGYFNSANKFDINGRCNLKTLNYNFDIHAMINPKNISDYLKRNSENKDKGIIFDEEIYIPISLKLNSNEKNNIMNFFISSTYHKLQLFNREIKFVPDINTLENLIGSGYINLQEKYFNINDLTYSGKDFGILLKAFGLPDKFSFSLESAPLLDLGEIAKIWSEDTANGQFRGKVFIKDFEPNNQSSWIKNIKAEAYSEEDVHDFAYGILYGKHFKFDMNTENGDGIVKLQTLKGKIKNLQVINLISELEIKNGLQAKLRECSLETADGKTLMQGDINLETGEADITGQMKDVDIETVSNNLFNNLGDYNGKVNLNFDMSGNFIDLMKSKPPEKAKGDFELKEGTMKQIAELSKGLNLANLVFGLPIYFSFNTIIHILQPEQDADFLSVLGKWSFVNTKKEILLKDIVYRGINGLHLYLSGKWNFVSKDLDFTARGFIPKKPMRITTNDIKVKGSEIKFAKKSRHFNFKIKGNIGQPNSLSKSVQKTIKFK